MLIAGVVSTAVALMTIPGALLTLVVCLAVIYLRGYLVPYTPTVTERYVPDRVLRWFDKDQPAVPESEEGLVDVEETLYSLDVVAECDIGTDLCLTPDFRAAWRQRMSEVEERETRQRAIASLLDVPEEKLSFQEFDSAVLVRHDGRQIGQWESQAALLADIAADSALTEWDDRWNEIDVVNRSRILNTLRMFLDTCPDCGGLTNFGQETVESCCRSIDVVAVTCTDCEARLFELEMTPDLR